MVPCGRARVEPLFLVQQEYIRMDLIKDLWQFMKVRKKFWLLPLILVLLVFGVLIVLTSGSAMAPFIYTIF